MARAAQCRTDRITLRALEPVPAELGAGLAVSLNRGFQPVEFATVRISCLAQFDNKTARLDAPVSIIER